MFKLLDLAINSNIKGFSGGASGKQPACQCRKTKETQVQFLGWADPKQPEEEEAEMALCMSNAPLQGAILAQPRTTCVTSGKLLKLSVLWFLYLKQVGITMSPHAPKHRHED